MLVRTKLAPVGSTGNTTHASASLPEANNLAALCVEFEITAVGGTPTVTYKVQGSLDDGSVRDADSDWFDLMVIPANSDTGVATDTKTAVGVYAYFLATPRLAIRKIRLVTSANTNVTYEADVMARVWA